MTRAAFSLAFANAYGPTLGRSFVTGPTAPWPSALKKCSTVFTYHTISVVTQEREAICIEHNVAFKFAITLVFLS
jgi:hypothetical protein